MVISQGKTQCSSKTQVVSEYQDTKSEISPGVFLVWVFFFPAGDLFTDLVQRGLLGMEASLLCVGMKEGGNRTLQVFIVKVYHAFGWLLVSKLIMLWKRYRSRTSKAWRESKREGA